MTRMTGASQGDLQQRVDMLERELSQLKEMMKMRWQERTPRLLLPSAGIDLFWGITQEAITKDGVAGDVEIQGGGDPVVEVLNKLGNIATSRDCYIIKPKHQDAYHLLSGECG